MLRVVEDLAASCGQKLYRFRDRLQIGLEGCAKHLAHVQGPGFAHDGEGRGVRLDQRAEIRIVFDTSIDSPGRPECCDACRVPFMVSSLFEELGVFRIRAWPTSFDISKPKVV